jgi:hypothetical protein
LDDLAPPSLERFEGRFADVLAARRDPNAG